VTASLLGVARIVGEAAPLLVTIFGNSVINANPFSGPQEALPLLTYQQIKLPLKSAIDLGFTAALVLYILVFALFVLARVLGSAGLGRSLHSLRRRKIASVLDQTALGEIEEGGPHE
jgi:phosphate transport system permease protein